MNKRLLSFVVLICIVTICAMGLIACAGEDGTPGNPQQLAAPTITLDGDTATWEATPKASGFEISVNGSILKVSATVTSRQLIEGVTIKVRAVGDGTSYLTSEWSNTVTYTKTHTSLPEPSHVQTTIASLVNNLPTETYAVVYEVSGTWSLKPNSETYGNGWLSDSYGNQITVYGLCKNSSVLTWDGTSYSFANNKSYLQTGVEDGDYIKVGMVYNVQYDNYCCYLISILDNPTVTPITPNDGEILISEFNANGTNYATTPAKMTGVVYCMDNYGFFMADATGSNVYVKMDNADVQVGQTVTVTGTYNEYYTMPQLVATSCEKGSVNASYNIAKSEKTIAQIILENQSQSAMVYNHKVYRTSGTLIQEGSQYYLVDGADRLHIKATASSLDLSALISNIGEKVTINVIISDLFTGTGYFRVLPLNGNAANIRVESTGSNSSPKDINFLMINDTHGALLDSSDGKSVGRVDSLLRSLESQNGDYIFIHNGDAFQGLYVCGVTYGLPLIEAFNAMELDCFVLGNHEFDWGLDKIAAYKDGNAANGEANFPFLGANVYYTGTTTRPDWIEPYTIVEQDGLKVGIIGVIGFGQETSILAKHVRDYDFGAPLAVIKSNATYLRDTAGCDVVVVATHDYDETLNESIAMLTASNTIDAIFCAHTHQNITEYETRSDSKNIPVVQCYHKNVNAAEVILKYDANNVYQNYIINKHLSESYPISSVVQAVINEYQSIINSASEEIGTTSGALSKDTLGGYAVEAMLSYNYATDYNFSGVDVAIMNTGGIRANIDAGGITKGDVFETLPFDNAVVLVNIQGSVLKNFCNSNKNYLYIEGSYASLNDNTTYQLAVIDYVFYNERYSDFDNLTPSEYIETDVVLRDLLMAELDSRY